MGAERTTVLKAVSEGETRFRSMAMASDTDLGFPSPDGPGRQFLAEFGEFPVYLVNRDMQARKGEREAFTAGGEGGAGTNGTYQFWKRKGQEGFRGRDGALAANQHACVKFQPHQIHSSRCVGVLNALLCPNNVYLMPCLAAHDVSNALLWRGLQRAQRLSSAGGRTHDHGFETDEAVST